MIDTYMKFIMSEKAEEIFGFKKTRTFISMDVTFIVILLGENQEYHLVFSMSNRWNKPIIEFFDSEFSDKNRMPYGRKWCRREVFDHVQFINVGKECYNIESYAKFSSVNHLIHEIDDKSISITPIVGFSPKYERLKKSTTKGDKISRIPEYV